MSVKLVNTDGLTIFVPDAQGEVPPVTKLP